MLAEARMAVWRWDPDADQGTSSALMNELWGLKPGQNLHESSLGYSLIHPDDLPRQQALIADVLKNGGTWHNEFRILRPRDGKVAWLEERAHGMKDPVTGKLTVDGVTWEVTERKRAEEVVSVSAARKDFLVRLEDAVRPLADAAAIQEASCRMLAEQLGADRVYYAEIHEDVMTAEIRPDYHRADLSSIAGFVDLHDFEKAFGHMRHGEALRLEDTHANEDAAGFDRLDARSVMGIPLVKEGRFIWVLGILSSTPRAWTLDEESLARETAERTWAAVQRAKAEEARRASAERLRESERKYRTLFQTIDEGFAVWKLLRDANGDPVDALLVEGNARFKALPGHGEVVGKTSLEIFPEFNNWWITNFHQVLSANAPLRFESYFEPIDGWLEVHLTPMGSVLPDQVAVVFTDITERRKSEEALRASELKYRTLFDSIDEGFCLVEMIFDASGRAVDFRYLEANPGFVRHAGFDPKGRRVREVIPDYEQELLDHYARALNSDEILRLEHPVKGLEGEWFRTTAFRYGDPSSRRVAIVFTNITAERQAAEVLRLSEARKDFLVRLEDALRSLDDPAAIQATAARLLGEQLEVDRVYYADIDEAQGLAEIPPGYAKGELPSIAAKYPLWLFEEPLRPLRKGEVLRIPDTWNEPDHPAATVEMFRAWGARAMLAAPLMKEARLRWALSVLHGEPRPWSDWEVALVRETAERTWAAVGRAQAERDLRASEQKYHGLFDSIDEGFALIEVLYRDGKAVDLFYHETNSAFARHAGIEAQGRRILDLIPDYERFWIDLYDGVARTGEVSRGEHPVHGLEDNWFRFAAFRYGAPGDNLVGVVFANVTEAKRAEKEREEFSTRLDMLVRERTADLKESRDLLQSVLDTSLVGMSYLQAVRDENGAVTDFVIRMLNKELERETGREDLVGRYYAQEFPGIRESGVFKTMVEALESGQPKALEYFYPYDGYNKWFSSMFIKFEDGLVATNLDVTAQKNSDLALKDAMTRLELENKIHAYAEEIGGMGTWTWNTAADEFVFSDNLYRLFGLKPREIDPDLREILPYVHPDDLERVQAQSARLRETGQRTVPLEYRVLRKDGALRHFTNRVQKVADLEGGHLLVGITEDVTRRKRDEDRTRRLRLDRLALEERQRSATLAAALNAQESERKRMSESLHNGIGQMLYGIQLNLNLLALKPGETWLERHAAQQARTTALLSQTIGEVRRVSHELMPSVLEDFGLKAALEDICKQYNGLLDIDCALDRLTGKAAPYLKIAIYRIVQELITNVLKHAQARRVRLSVSGEGDHYHIGVSDDGKGFDPLSEPSGIGLRTIRDKVDLHKGTFEVDTGSDGTHIRIRLPYSGEPLLPLGNLSVSAA